MGLLDGAIGGTLAGAAGNLASSVPNAVTTQDTKTNTNQGTTSVAGQAGEQTTQTLQDTAPTVNTAIEKTAEYTKNLEPIVQSATDSAQHVTNLNESTTQVAHDNYVKSVQSTSDGLIATDHAIQQMGEAAKIDPTRYQTNLGLRKQTLAALGMALSGIGAGLTGQPNMAMEVFQRNLDRDIDAQKQTFLNLKDVADARLKQVNALQNNQAMNSTAQSAASVGAFTGINSILDSVSALSKVGTVKWQADLLKQLNSQNLLKAYDDHAKVFTTQTLSGNQENMNAIGLMLKQIFKHTTAVPAPKTSAPPETKTPFQQPQTDTKQSGQPTLHDQITEYLNNAVGSK